MLPVISTTPIWKNKPKKQTENDYRWLLCIFRRGGLGEMREIADSIGAYLFVDMAHVRAWLLLASTRTRFLMLTLLLHHSQNPGGSARRSDPGERWCEELYKKLNSAVFPGGQGGP